MPRSSYLTLTDKLVLSVFLQNLLIACETMLIMVLHKYSTCDPHWLHEKLDIFLLIVIFSIVQVFLGCLVLPRLFKHFKKSRKDPLSKLDLTMTVNGRHSKR